MLALGVSLVRRLSFWMIERKEQSSHGNNLEMKTIQGGKLTHGTKSRFNSDARVTHASRDVHELPG
jgi:hypothetical protein